MSSTYPPSPPTRIGTALHHSSPPTAFTGADNVLPAATVFVVLALIGAAALRLAHRRRPLG